MNYSSLAKFAQRRTRKLLMVVILLIFEAQLMRSPSAGLWAGCPLAFLALCPVCDWIGFVLVFFVPVPQKAGC
jgi:hypothetical protein